MYTEAQNFPWIEELEKTIVTSLATSFGLDFLLFKDRVGGEVDTVQNVRSGIWASAEEQHGYEQRGEYSGKAYHQHSNYIAKGKQDKSKHAKGLLWDPYRSKAMSVNEQRNLDHVVSAKEIHDDAGRVLAGLSGVELANQNSNLQSTSETINKSKKQTPINDYLNKVSSLVSTHEKTLQSDRERLMALPQDTPQQRNDARALEDKIRKTENKINELKSLDHDAMRRRDAEARIPYDQQINKSYYTSSKFIKQFGSAAGSAGMVMGTRQVLGLVLAEVWFELRQQLQALMDKLKSEFSLEKFIESIGASIRGIWKRVQSRFKDFVVVFKDGVFAGVLSSLTTTLINIFVTTQAMAAKIIRELWGQLVKAIKVMFFNPDQLGFVERCRLVTSILATAAATVIGTIVYGQLVPVLSFPFGSELAAFASALVTGLVTLGLNYFLLYSRVARKVWEYIESKMPHAFTLQQFRAINGELDRYLLNLSRVEFGMDVEELRSFTLDLNSCGDEIERSLVLKQATDNLGVELPFEVGDTASTRNWLASLV